MKLIQRPRRAVRTAFVAAASASLLGVMVAVAQPSHAATCSVLFDDFTYSGPTDSQLRSHGWGVRTSNGGPGIGASWPQSSISFPTADSQQVLQLTATSDGTAAGTTQSEITQGRRFFEGTYASRIKFVDVPASGPDGDHLVETFFTITPSAPAETYGEIDFEYLGNGGWGQNGPTMFMSTWESTSDVTGSSKVGSLAGWHDFVFTVSGGRVTYYIDGALVADHGDRFYPETSMLIDYNLWFIDTAGHSGAGVATYQQQVDWLYFAGNEVVSPSEAVARANGYRAAGTTFTDTVGTAGACTPPIDTTSSPTVAPTTPPIDTTSPPTVAPTTPPIDTTSPPVAPTDGTWAPYIQYSLGQVVTYNGVRYSCRQPHQSLPGWEPGSTPALWQAV
jgi:hypothetical protein